MHRQVAKGVISERQASIALGWSALLSMDVPAWQRAFATHSQRVVAENPPPLAVRRAGDVDWAELIGSSVAELGLAEPSPFPLKIEVRASSSIPLLGDILNEAETRAESRSQRPLSVSLVPQSEITPLIALRFSDAPAHGMEAAWQMLGSAALTASFQFNRLKIVS